MLRTVLVHLRAQWIGVLALLIALGTGSAYAANTVFSTDIVNGEVKSIDVGNNQIVSADVRDDIVAGGGLNSQDIAANALKSADVANNSLRGADVAEATLGRVPTATLGGLGRGGPIQDTCNPADTGFASCATVQLTVPPGPGARVLVLGRVRAFPEGGASEGIGVCQLGASAVGPVPDTTVDFVAPDHQFVNLVGITPLLGPGVHTFGIECNQNDTDSDIDYDSASVQAVAISPG